MIRVRSSLLQASLDLQVDERLTGAELLQISRQWLQERYAESDVLSGTLLIRAQDRQLLMMDQTLKANGVMNDDLLYLF